MKLEILDIDLFFFFVFNFFYIDNNIMNLKIMNNSEKKWKIRNYLIDNKNNKLVLIIFNW
jgi:hypothetical protein